MPEPDSNPDTAANQGGTDKPGQQPGETANGPGSGAQQQVEQSALQADRKPQQGDNQKDQQAQQQSADSDLGDDDDDEPQEDPAHARHRFIGRAVSAVIVLVTLVIAAIVIAETNANPRTDDAEVFANYIGMAPQVDGPISRLAVHDNQAVRAGDVLFEIDDRPYRYALERANSDQQMLEGQITDEQRTIRSQQSAAVAAAAGTRSAQANVARSASSIDEAKADVSNSEAALKSAQADYTYSLNNLHRVEPLLQKQFVTVDQVDQLRTGTATKELAVHQAQSQLALSQARLQSMLAAYDQSVSSVAQSQAQKQQSEHAVTTLDPLVAQRQGRASAVSNAQYNFNNCIVRAPFDARVTNLALSEGAYAHTGQQVFTLIDTRVWWVIANFRETQMHRVLPGMHVDVYLMEKPNVLYDGVVESASYGVTPDPTVLGVLQPGLPDAQRTLSWVHLASRYPVRIRIQGPVPDTFRIGQSAVVVVRGFRK